MSVVRRTLLAWILVEAVGCAAMRAERPGSVIRVPAGGYSVRVPDGIKRCATRDAPSPGSLRLADCDSRYLPLYVIPIPRAAVPEAMGAGSGACAALRAYAATHPPSDPRVAREELSATPVVWKARPACFHEWYIGGRVERLPFNAIYVREEPYHLSGLFVDAGGRFLWILDGTSIDLEESLAGLRSSNTARPELEQFAAGVELER